MCECIVRHLPIGQDEWELVTEEHNTKWPTKNRTVDQLRRQFAKLHKKKIPTGDPSCPPEVKAAKRCKYLIRERADLGEGNSDVSNIDDNINADDDDDADADDHDLEADAEDPRGEDQAAPAAAGATAAAAPPARHRHVYPSARLPPELGGSGDDDGRSIPGFAPEPMVPQAVSPIPRPVRHSRKGKKCGTSSQPDASVVDMNSILKLCEMQVLQGLASEAQQKRDRREERRMEHREQHRSDERMMQMMMIIASFFNPSLAKKLGKRKRDQDDDGDDTPSDSSDS
jgi:hypothetical protein